MLCWVPAGVARPTALRLIAGLESPDTGTIEINEQVVAGPGTAVPPEKRQVGMVFQEYALFPHMSVRDNIAFGLPRGPARAERTREMVSLASLENSGGANAPRAIGGPAATGSPGSRPCAMAGCAPSGRAIFKPGLRPP